MEELGLFLLHHFGSKQLEAYQQNEKKSKIWREKLKKSGSKLVVIEVEVNIPRKNGPYAYGPYYSKNG